MIGKERCPIVDTWWQTETGSIMLAPLPGVTPTKPGSCTRPLPGVVAEIVNEQGESLGPNQGGLLVLKQPWPSMLRTLYGDHERFKETYFGKIAGCYFAGDGARRDADGYYWVMGRVDDVLNVSGHRLSTMEVESALVSHAAVAEAAVVGFPHEIKGEGICCFVSLKQGDGDKQLKSDLIAHVRKQIGPLATPDEIRFTVALPKTRSGQNHAPPAPRHRRRPRDRRRHQHDRRLQRPRENCEPRTRRSEFVAPRRRSTRRLSTRRRSTVVAVPAAPASRAAAVSRPSRALSRRRFCWANLGDVRRTSHRAPGRALQVVGGGPIMDCSAVLGREHAAGSVPPSRGS